jgi:phosphocarrier protein HPr
MANNDPKKTKTLSEKLCVVNAKGMHLAAAGELVKVTGRYRSSVTLSYKGERVSGKSLLSVVSLGVACGQCFYAHVAGPDAKQLIKELRQVVASGFGAGPGPAADQDDA